uniref:Nucleolar protein 4 n=1 Tax=Homo sapiens TaxID=9606 RepID=K7EIK8_HUMAN
MADLMQETFLHHATGYTTIYPFTC